MSATTPRSPAPARRPRGATSLRRVEDGTVSDEQADRLGTTLMRLDEAMNELTGRFGIERSELNIDLGPLGPLLDS